MDYLRWYQESDADGDTMDTAELAVAYAKHCLSEELREVFAIHKAEIDALKAQRDALLAAQQWQPIESAPSDEVLFLHNKAMGLSGVGYLNSYLDFWSWSYSSNPTHWQPLPPPPEAKARGDRV